ncbi:hypothetical protein Salat_1484700 [Sesamum alatum]|uniref:Myb/SANT-like domain-containing protein n=1 Tax=Sesamum alatum TaxID=300844 RepID=A0AAE2CM32_9LAMI|nr:hypothetical protein Salat_1484700 [Sesamum alatum]
MDDLFINTLVDSMPHHGNGPYNGVTVNFLIAAQRAVNAGFGKRLSWRYCVEHYNHLREQHSTFVWLIRQEGVFWMRRWRQLWADREVWDSIGRKLFALAYRWRPEPKWESLKLIFGEVENDDDTSSDSVDSGEDSATSSATEVEISDNDQDHSSSS